MSARHYHLRLLVLLRLAPGLLGQNTRLPDTAPVGFMRNEGCVTKLRRSIGLLELHCRSASADQIEDQHYYRDDDQQVNQVAANSPEETQQPKNEKNDKDRPKHDKPPSLSSC